MNHSFQVFQATSLSRWKLFKRVLLFGLLITAAFAGIFLISLRWEKYPSLPGLGEKARRYERIARPRQAIAFPRKNNKKYTGFKSFLLAKAQMEKLDLAKPAKPDQIRAVFYSPWRREAADYLRRYGGNCNTIFPEWFFIDTLHQTLDCRIDTASLKIMKEKKLRILPVLSNFHSAIHPDEEGYFDGELVKELLNHPGSANRLIKQLTDTLRKYELQGINTDFEELSGITPTRLAAFQESLGISLHPFGMQVTIDISAGNPDYDPVKLAKADDYLVLMAYDQHYSESIPGPVAAQRWVEAALDLTARNVSSNKIILGMPAYGYDWPEDGKATNISYYEALDLARKYRRPVQFDNDSYNLHFSYSDEETDEETGRPITVKHEIWFTDAATLYNLVRFSDDYAVAGTSVWNMGTEDPRLWTFYGRSLTYQALEEKPFDYNALQRGYADADGVTFEGEGELLEIENTPTEGRIQLTVDPADNIITEQSYKQLPSEFVIRKFGEDTSTNNRTIVLTFDDGPDPRWTPRILDILEKNHVPATFFIVGMEAEKHIPLLRRIYNDGFEIGNHTFTHRNIAGMGAERASLEIRLTRLLIECITGHTTVLFRPPYNADSEPRSFQELVPIERSREENYYTVGESIDPMDWENNGYLPPDSIFNRIIRLQREKSGSIILLHDAGGDTREATIHALPKIIAYFKQKGFRFGTVAQLAGKSREEIMPALPDTEESGLVALNYLPASLIYWGLKTLNILLFTGIFLSVARMLLVAWLAYRQKKTNSERKNILLAVPESQLPRVSIIVPAYNESINAVSTVSSLLEQDYPHTEIIFVDDGSTDPSFELVQSAFRDHPRVHVFSKTNGGKASALNFGIQQSNFDYLVCIDADTRLKPDAVRKLIERILINGASRDASPVAAVAGNVKAGNEVNLLTRWQSIEYITAQNFDRRAFDLLNAITVVPGAIGAFYKPALEKVGGFTTDTLAEDCDLTMRLLKAGYRVTSATEAIAYTEVPETLASFLKQRFRWSFGVMQSFWKHRRACFRPNCQNFGMIALPNILLFQILLPFLAPVADLFLVVSLLAGLFQFVDVDFNLIWISYFLFTMVDLGGALLAFSYEKEKPAKLIWLIPQRLAYRQIMYYVFLKSVFKAIKGEVQGWGHLKRTGHIKQFLPV